MSIPIRYLPPTLSRKDKEKQLRMLSKSKRLYKSHKFYTRKALPSYKNKPSKHVQNARKIYNVDHIRPSNELAKATGCSKKALRKIAAKGEGAYFSSGSRPNQTAQSWGYARLASAITGGKSAAVDFDILEKGCAHNKRAFTYAKKAKAKYGYGHGKTRKVHEKPIYNN
jgi:DNA-binding Xre family transcriptional regulator